MSRDVQGIKDALIDLRNSTEEIRTLQDLIDRYQERLEGLGAKIITDMPRSPSPDHDRITVALSEKIALEKELDDVLGTRKKMMDHIKKVIKKLRDPRERAVIRLMYLYGTPEDKWEDVCFQMFQDRRDYWERKDSYLRRTFEIHQRALEHMAEIELRRRQ